MAASLSDYLANALLTAANGGAALTFPGSLYLAFYTVDPTHADTGTEVAGYTRPLFTATEAGRILTSSADITVSDFPTATIVAAGIRDALTAGHLLVSAPYSLSVVAGTIYRWPAGSITFDLSA